jgi:hypothetical protein
LLGKGLVLARAGDGAGRRRQKNRRTNKCRMSPGGGRDKRQAHDKQKTFGKHGA